MQNPICIIAAINLNDGYYIAPIAINFQIDPALGIARVSLADPNLAYETKSWINLTVSAEYSWGPNIHRLSVFDGDQPEAEFNHISHTRWSALMEKLAQYKTWVENVQAFVPKSLEFKEVRFSSHFLTHDGVEEILFFNFNQPIGVDDVIALKENPTH